MATKKQEGRKSSQPSVLDRLSATLALDDDVSRVRLVSPTRARALEKFQIKTVKDLLGHYPRRYLDMSLQKSIADAVIGDSCTIVGHVHRIELKRPRPKFSLVEISLVDETGLLIITAFRQPWLMDSIKTGMRLVVAGKCEFNYGYKRMTNPLIEEIEEGITLENGLIIPVHPATERISTAWMRRLISNALSYVQGAYDPLPLDLRTRYRLMSRYAALSAIHFPHSMEDAHEARRRLAYEEVFLLELALMTEGNKRSEGKQAQSHEISGPKLQRLDESLPFDLTDDQIQARQEVLAALASHNVANHMVLGDVGTGKTIIAAFAIAAAADSKTQTLFMAPTEILAHQHANNLGPLFEEAGVSWELLTGATPDEKREEIKAKLTQGEIDVLIGTHALLEKDVECKNCSLVIIDEQQRFGVNQRATLLHKGENPDALYLTATPIPRSLALALYGNLSLSYLKHRPYDTKKRKTFVHAKSQRGEAYDAATKALSRGEQVYVVCPLVGIKEEKPAAKKSTSLADAHEDEYEYEAISIEDENDFGKENTAAVKKEAQFLQAKVFPDYTVELLHGKMKSDEKQEVMRKFSAGEIDVLVATTVIEVGIDVENATVMIIEDADRFGLAQLHQLRGRVGRGKKAGEVHLVSSMQTDAALQRLNAMTTTDDGFELATYDLSLRREGDILGNRQHGASSLKLVNVVRDGAMIEAAHKDAAAILELDPHLEDGDHQALKRELRLSFKDSVVEGG